MQTLRQAQCIASLRGIANKAAQDKSHWFRNLFGLLTMEFLLWCWQFVNKKAAAGVDRKSAAEYALRLEYNVGNLVASVKGGWYRAKLVLRKYIPKLNGKLRPLGIPAIADKLLQTLRQAQGRQRWRRYSKRFMSRIS
jgi:retron-type reverse transcriptase